MRRNLDLENAYRFSADVSISCAVYCRMQLCIVESNDRVSVHDTIHRAEVSWSTTTIFRHFFWDFVRLFDASDNHDSDSSNL